MTESLHRVLAALTEASPDLDVWAIADALWLGAMAGNELGSTDPGDSASPNHPAPANPVTPGLKPVVEDSQVTGSLRRRLPGRRDEVPAHEIVVRPAQTFTASQRFPRALQPLTRPWLHGARGRVDIDATVDAYASSGILSPVMKPEPERWFGLVVIADTTSSMAVWRWEITAFTALLRSTGVFRNTSVWQLDPADATLTDRRGRIGNPAGRVTTPGGRRLVMLFSDFASAGWRATPAWRLIHSLATTTPTVLIDPLPPHLWSYSGLDAPTTVVRAPAPGVGNSVLRFHLSLTLQALKPEGDWLPVPFSGFTAPSLGQWANALMRTEPKGCEAILLNLDWIAESASVQAEEKPVADRVDAFLHTASPSAARLAVLCSPFPHFSLPLLDLIRHTVVTEADLSDVAEFLVSGLLETTNPGADQPVLSFHDGAAEQLRAHLTYHDAWHTFDAITRHVAAAPQAGNAAFDLSAVVVDPNSTTLVAADTHPFAEAVAGLQQVLTRQNHAINLPVETVTETSEQRQATPRRRVFISYASDSQEHVERVARFATFLADECGVAVSLDQWSDADRMDWTKWATREIVDADFAVMVYSPEYSHRRHALRERELIRDLVATDRVLPVILPYTQIKLPAPINPSWLRLGELTIDGLAPLLEKINPDILARRSIPGRHKIVMIADQSDLEILCEAFGNERYFHKRLAYQRQNRGMLLIAWQAGRPAGNIYIRLEPADEPELRKHLPRVPLLNHVEVHDDYRNMGISTDLIHAAERNLRDIGHDLVALPVRTGDTNARRLFERLGYSKLQLLTVAVRYEHRFPDGTWGHEVKPSDILVKELSDDPVPYLDRLLALPSVHLVIDGAIAPIKRQLSATEQREGFIQQLGRVIAGSSAEITVVFEGAGVADLPSSTPHGVRVLYSDPRVSAQRLIRALIAAENEEREVAVVTADQALADSVVELGAHHVAPALLLARLDRR